MPRYWSVNLETSCPEYRGLVDELGDRLVTVRFDGRWMGMSVLQGSSIAWGSPDVGDPLRWFCRTLVGCICRHQDATHFVEDTPFNLLAFGRVLDLLPEARLVHIHRDPRDVVASYLGRSWSPSDPLMAARFYAAVMRRWDHIRDGLPQGSFMEIGLEALVGDPELVLRHVCEFWGLPWHPPLLDVDLSRSHTGRWRREIPQAAVPEVERVLGPYLERYGA